MIRLTQVKIDELIAEPKHLPIGYRHTLLGKLKSVDAHKRSELRVMGTNNSEFYILVRQARANLLNFSLILRYSMIETTGVFILRRYNGKSHEHTNKLEGNRFRDFHIHFATERYQAQGFAEEAYAEVTDRYSDLDGALECMISDCGFIRPPDEPARLL
jgi:hypothetical protein